MALSGDIERCDCTCLYIHGTFILTCAVQYFHISSTCFKSRVSSLEENLHLNANNIMFVIVICTLCGIAAVKCHVGTAGQTCMHVINGILRLCVYVRNVPGKELYNSKVTHAYT